MKGATTRIREFANKYSGATSNVSGSGCDLIRIFLGNRIWRVKRRIRVNQIASWILNPGRKNSDPG
jgi:hypothetical protein